MQTIGERLEEARKKKGVSIREAAEATKIRGDYLQKFESNQFDIGLTEIYTRGFLRTYANFLKVPVDRVMSDYAALGRGEVRPRQPSREIYGRMDITVSTSGESGERAPEAESAPQPNAEAAPSRPQPHYPRGTGSSLPTGMDPAVMYKWLKIGGAIVGFLIVVFVIKSLFTGRSSAQRTTDTTAAAPATTTAPQRTMTLIASDLVTVRVTRLLPSGADGEEVYRGTLNRGQRAVVPLPGPVNIAADVGERLKIEYRGTQYDSGFVGNGYLQMK